MHRETNNIESIHIRIETWIKVYDNDAITYHPVARSRKFPPMFRREHFARGARTRRITFDRIRSTLKSRITIFTTSPMIPRVPCTFDVGTSVARSGSGRRRGFPLSVWAGPILPREEKFPWQSVREEGGGRWRGWWRKGGKRGSSSISGRLVWKFKPMFYDGFLFRVFYWAEGGYSRQSRSLAIRENRSRTLPLLPRAATLLHPFLPRLFLLPLLFPLNLCPTTIFHKTFSATSRSRREGEGKEMGAHARQPDPRRREPFLQGYGLKKRVLSVECERLFHANRNTGHVVLITRRTKRGSTLLFFSFPSSFFFHGRDIPRYRYTIYIYIYSPPPPTKVEIFILLVVVIVEATLFESGEKNVESHRARLRLNPRSVTWYKLYARFTRLTRKGK